MIENQFMPKRFEAVLREAIAQQHLPGFDEQKTDDVVSAVLASLLEKFFFFQGDARFNDVRNVDKSFSMIAAPFYAAKRPKVRKDGIVMPSDHVRLFAIAGQATEWGGPKFF